LPKKQNNTISKLLFFLYVSILYIHMEFQSPKKKFETKQRVRHAIKEKADERGREIEETVPISNLELLEGTATGGGMVSRPVGGAKIPKFKGGGRYAQKLGGMYMKEMMELDPEIQGLLGSGLFDKFLLGMKEFAKGAAYPVKAIAKLGDAVGIPTPLKVVGKVLEGVDDPQFAKDLGIGLKKKGKGIKKGGATLETPLQVANPSILGAGKGKKSNISMTIDEIIPMPSHSGGLSSGGKKRGTGDWIAFVKKVATNKGIPYGQALKVASKMRR
jgi:hypothetical protein